MFVKHRAYSDSEGFPWTVLAVPSDVEGRTEMVVKRWYEDEIRVAVLGEDGIATVVDIEGKTLTLDPEHAITPEEAQQQSRKRDVVVVESFTNAGGNNA